MKRVGAACVILLAVGQIALAAEGVVVFNHPRCQDRFVVETGNGFAILERQEGSDPAVGTVLIGDYETYSNALQDVQDPSGRIRLRVWVEYNWLSESRAIKEMRRYCR